MRADRLVAILLLLQRKGRVTAAEVAEELEISERTARRDLESLGMAGIPVYSQQGRNGGWSLAGGGKTDLSGLTAGEARALFLVAGPASSATPEVPAALRKLVRALPEPMRVSEEAAASAIVVDERGWDDSRPQRATPPHLDAVQQAVVDGVQLELGYVARDWAARSTRTVHPLGVASKGPNWYLVADTDNGLRTFRVDRISSVAPTGAPAVRPEGFDLNEAWALIADEVEQKRTPVHFRAWAKPDSVNLVRWVLGARVRIGPPGPDGRIEVELRGHTVHTLAYEIAGFGNRLEVIDPPQAREVLLDIAAQLSATYGR